MKKYVCLNCYTDYDVKTSRCFDCNQESLIHRDFLEESLKNIIEEKLSKKKEEVISYVFTVSIEALYTKSGVFIISVNGNMPVLKMTFVHYLNYSEEFKELIGSRIEEGSVFTATCLLKSKKPEFTDLSEVTLEVKNIKSIYSSPDCYDHCVIEFVLDIDGYVRIFKYSGDCSDRLRCFIEESIASYEERWLGLSEFELFSEMAPVPGVYYGDLLIYDDDRLDIISSKRIMS